MQSRAVLLADCPLQDGITERVSALLGAHGAETQHVDQFADSVTRWHFLRVELTVGGAGAVAAEKFARIRRELAVLAAPLQVNWSLEERARLPRVALFCSLALHCVKEVLESWRAGDIDCEFPLVISNHRVAEPLTRLYGLPFVHTPISAATRAEVEAQQIALCDQHRIDLVVLARYMQILTPAFVSRYSGRIINVHHSLLPAFIGARPYHQAYARGVKLIGATSHYVTEELDGGPIIAQAAAPASHRDRVEDLMERGHDMERIVLRRAVQFHLNRKIIRHGNKTVVFD